MIHSKNRTRMPGSKPDARAVFAWLTFCCGVRWGLSAPKPLTKGLRPLDTKRRKT